MQWTAEESLCAAPPPYFLSQTLQQKMLVYKLPRVCFLLLLLLLCIQRLSGQGLYPPIVVDNNNNFASFQTVTATSTCNSSCLSSCSGCNSTCPYGQTLPSPVNLFAVGSRAVGVVSIRLAASTQVLKKPLVFCRPKQALLQATCQYLDSMEA